jgi:hypothetical protein
MVIGGNSPLVTVEAQRLPQGLPVGLIDRDPFDKLRVTTRLLRHDSVGSA